jgi:hypothetical protein
MDCSKIKEGQMIKSITEIQQDLFLCEQDKSSWTKEQMFFQKMTC